MGPFVKEWHNATTLHPLGAVVLLVGILALMLAPRRRALWPVFAVACFIAPAQRLVVLTLDFDLLRVMVLAGWARLILRSELVSLRWRPVDFLVIALPVWQVLAVLLRGDTSSLVHRFGDGFDIIGGYFLVRHLVRDLEDLRHAIRGFALLAIPVAAAFAVEYATQRNAFSVFGGVPEFTAIRDGRLRCQGAFAHPILAGCFWAALLPMLAMSSSDTQGRLRLLGYQGVGMIAVAAGLVIVAACSSSTPVMSVIAGMLAMAALPLRSLMWVVRWGALISAIGLHLLMEAPIWHLISRVNVVGGSTGYYRYRLINAAIEHVHEWGFLGGSNFTWGAHLLDVTNYYIVQGLRGGLLQLALFLVLVGFAFREVGVSIRRAEHERHRGDLLLSWAIGASLFVHCISFLGVSYFGQIRIVWIFTLAAATIAAASCAQRATRRQPASKAEARLPSAQARHLRIPVTPATEPTA